jgi:hypothetical protein
MPTQPSDGIVTSPYGMRVNPNDGIWRMHYGEDTNGVGNYAPATGTVVFAGWDKSGTGLGWAVGIRETMNPAVIWWVGHHGTTALWNPLKVKVGSKVSERYTYLGPKGYTGAAKGAHAHTERRTNGAAIPGSGTASNPRNYYKSGGFSGGGVTPIPVTLEASEMKYIHAPAGATTKPLWALIDLVAFRSAGGVLVTDVQTTAENYSRVCPTPAEVVTRDEFNASVTAANLFVEQVVNASFATAPVDISVVSQSARDGAAEAVAGIKFPTYGPVA